VVEKCGERTEWGTEEVVGRERYIGLHFIVIFLGEDSRLRGPREERLKV